jgi:shikimate 5-dehydrogenase
VLVTKGKLMGYNTDLPAIAWLLGRKTTVRGKRVTIMGAGGTARTMAYAAIQQGAKPTIVGRSPQRAEALASELGCEWTGFENLDKLETDILMNATPVGMHPAKDAELAPRSLFHGGMTVLDAVARPAMTPLLVSARASGCTIVTGMELFNWQAELQSKLFLRHIA